MDGKSKKRADDVVEAFKARLGGDAIAAVGEHQFHALRDMVREALAEQSEVIVERLQRELEEIRSELIERRALEI